MITYRDFLSRKHIRQTQVGFDVPLSAINPKMRDFQKVITQWSLRIGRAALFEDCGLGKTFQQLEWGHHVCQHTGGNVLLLCPLAVQWQTVREADKFGIGTPVSIAENQSQVKPGITVANYEKLHHFDASSFSGVILDESSVLKAFTGKTKQSLCNAFANTPYRLACTATPAPNDRMELGNHSEFLGVMPSDEMLSRWFINDGGKAGTYRLRRHGEGDFWRWMASWSVCISTPADLGFDATGYVLPELRTYEHVIESGPAAGELFAIPKDISATEVHKEKRAALSQRADCVSGLVNGNSEAWAVWCDTDYEADALCERIPDAVEVRGSHKDSIKAERLKAFSDGDCRVIVTKAEIAGFGLNWQHANNTTWFAGYSYERFYQAIRRLLRFGQTKPVNCHLVRTTNEGSIADTIKRKQAEHSQMQSEMAALMGEGMREEMGILSAPTPYVAEKQMTRPAWLARKEAAV
jgi:hypothetical protein